MFWVLFWFAVGCVVGWSVPQPQWAKDAQVWLKERFMDLVDKFTTNGND